MGVKHGQVVFFFFSRTGTHMPLDSHWTMPTSRYIEQVKWLGGDKPAIIGFSIYSIFVSFSIVMNRGDVFEADAGDQYFFYSNCILWLQGNLLARWFSDNGSDNGRGEEDIIVLSSNLTKREERFLG